MSLCMRARKQTITVDSFLHSSDNVYNVFVVEYCDNLYNYLFINYNIFFSLYYDLYGAK